MAMKTVKRGASAPRPDRRSKKRSGTVKQTVRLTVDENKLLRLAADLEGMSIAFWSKRLLLAGAKKRIAQEPTTT